MKKLIITLIVALAAFLHAQDSSKTVKETVKLTKDVKPSWTLSIGINYREMGDLDLDIVEATDAAFGVFLDGSVTEIVEGFFLFTVNDPMQQVDGTELDKVTFTAADTVGGTSRLDNGTGLIIRAEKGAEVKGWGMYEVLSLATSWVDSGSRAGLSATYYEYDTGQNWNTMPWGGTEDPETPMPDPPPPGSPWPDWDTVVGSNNSNAIVPNGNAIVNARYDVELGLYTFGGGLASTYNNDAFRFYVGAGPSLTVVDYDVKLKFTGRWADGSGVFATASEGEACTKFRAGLYAEVGIEYGFNERWGVGVSGRYDWIPVDANTNIGNLELSGVSTQISLTYRF